MLPMKSGGIPAVLMAASLALASACSGGAEQPQPPGHDDATSLSFRPLEDLAQGREPDATPTSTGLQEPARNPPTNQGPVWPDATPTPQPGDTDLGPGAAPTQTPTPTATPGPTGLELTAYAAFENAIPCLSQVTGYANGQNTFTTPRGDCPTPETPLLFSVTHETKLNTHWRLDAQGHHINDLNYTGDDRLYMNDYSYQELVNKPTILTYNVTPQTNASPLAALALDTINTVPFVDVTGRDVRDGFLFMGFNDTSLWAEPLTSDFYIELSYRVRAAEVGGPATSLPDQPNGHRLVLGVLLDWPEPAPRTNRSHFLEFNLAASPGFHAAQENSPCPADGLSYDHCFNDSSAAGSFPEGKYIAINKFYEYHDLAAIADLGVWQQIRIPLSSLIRTYGWIRPPASWSKASLKGLYFGIEGQGTSRMWVELKSYQLHRGKISVPASSVPNGLFRVAASLDVRLDTSTYCSIAHPEQMRALGYTQSQYDTAPLIMSPQIGLTYRGVCPLPKGLYRSGSVGIYSDGAKLCALGSGQQMISYGFTQTDYDNATQVGDYTQLNYSGACP